MMNSRDITYQPFWTISHVWLLKQITYWKGVSIANGYVNKTKYIYINKYIILLLLYNTCTDRNRTTIYIDKHFHGSSAVLVMNLWSSFQ